MKDIVIIGGGHAASAAAAKLRSLDFSGTITVISAEQSAPYHRPPLSKKYLLGEMDDEAILLRPEKFYQDQDIKLLTNQVVHHIDVENRQVETRDGAAHPWDKLLLTTGSHPRHLPATMVEGEIDLYTVRTLDDVKKMRPAFQSGGKVLIIGGGYIGLEAAAVAKKFALDVVVLEAAPRILQRVACEETSDFIRVLHQQNGVDILENARLAKLVKTDSQAQAHLEDGRCIGFDFAIVGIGVNPATELAEKAGLTIRNGIVVDDQARTSHADIFAAGDCAAFTFQGAEIRLESVQNANDQAEIAARAMLGEDVVYQPVPWFWSDQFDLKMQIAGLNRGYDKVIVRPGQRDGALSHWYYAGERLLAVDAFNDGGAFMAAKRMLEANRLPCAQEIADHAKSLKDIMKQTLSR